MGVGNLQVDRSQQRITIKSIDMIRAQNLEETDDGGLGLLEGLHDLRLALEAFTHPSAV